MRLALISNFLKAWNSRRKATRPARFEIVGERCDCDQYEMLIAAAAHHFGDGSTMVAVALESVSRPKL